MNEKNINGEGGGVYRKLDISLKFSKCTAIWRAIHTFIFNINICSWNSQMCLEDINIAAMVST